MGVLPNLLVVGAQKCGTTWLHQRLGEHPDIFMSAEKELRFFSKPHWETLVEDYAGHFTGGATARYRGESSPNYFWAYNPEAGIWRTAQRNANRDMPAAVLRLLGREVRLLLTLRHPVRRAVSAYVHHFRRGRICPGESLLEAGERLGLIDMGRYRRNHEAWEAAFGPDPLFVVFLEDIEADGQGVLDRVFDHLEVERVRLPRADRPSLSGRPLHLEAEDLVCTPEDGAAPPLRIRPDELAALQRLYREDIDYACRRLGAERLGWRRTPEPAELAG
jgi:hypothetical protein